MEKINFFKYPKSIEKEISLLKFKPPSYWEKIGEKNVLDIFKYSAKTVPAYKKFLKKHKINPKNIKIIVDFKKIPQISKKNYIRTSEFIDLFPDRDISHLTTFSATSGSTGEPTYFPRGENGDSQYEYIAEIFLRNQFDIYNKKTLGIVGFGLGIWIGGLFTYKNFNKIASKGCPLALIPVGPNKDLYLKSILKFGHLYDQIILMGYAPFIRDVIDDAPTYGVDFKKYNIKIFTAAEGYSEEFKDYIAEKTGVKNKFTDMVNLYGTVELGTMAHETSFSNLIRDIANKNIAVKKELFKDRLTLPTLAQYYPHLTYFEEINGEVVGSGAFSMPLLRYSFPDVGGVIKFDEMIAKLRLVGVDVIKEAKKYGIDKKILKLPFVYVYERADFTIVVRGVNIHPAEIKHSIENKDFQEYFTGKFTLIKKYNKNFDEYFEVNIEMKKNIKPSKGLNKKIKQAVVEYLNKTNSEFNDQYRSAPNKITPKVIFWSYQHHRYFQSTAKHKWAVHDNK
ncbi:MAG: hypothetical protein US71_C0001G0085 [Parcubacteria group bacterium GW2011_GWD2_38_12]|nr:MAG: hypothetical protein US06_C0013G0004 [Parcubacteria group bacterium GW2011_GWC2_36_17]KKQ43484.1 MAG: hypothetical protein US61_C0010G0016 [Parcubacteria group bacterium GW2011_GWE2_37_8]KKQ52882.1 MAG: hypothetical protein US71_C0001G0085 [Parcubacteria group bacterium GW2011_GWD2_38_12]KKQ59085.1 MAG: hypothetical protein US79_C0001G0084 [Parcubacteria group bacterium GW2011_GWC1_38_17]KKQ59700.1 MAG: hypothetical protein US78_C0001G0060 [Parcubacteria group bacterium GW2011_GWD1_38_1